MPLLSIITINYNNESGLLKTINSIVSQSFQDFEYVVIDGLSSDSSIEVIKSNKRINYWISENDNGIYDAMNKGILKANGEYILFLNSGDALVNDTILENLKSVFYKKKSFYYGNIIIEKNNLQEKHIAPPKIDLDFMLNSTFWHPCVFIKSDLFKTHNLYNTRFKIAGDYEFFIRCLLKPNITTECVNEVITLFDGNGISNDVAQADLQLKERELAWKLNISELVYDGLKKQNAFSRSKYATLFNSLQKIRGKQVF